MHSKKTAAKHFAAGKQFKIDILFSFRYTFLKQFRLSFLIFSLMNLSGTQ